MFSLQPPGKRIMGSYITACACAESYRNPKLFREEVERNLIRDTADALVSGGFVKVTTDKKKYNEIHTIDFYAMSQAEFDACIEAAYTAGRRAEANMYSWARVGSTKGR
jgi:hypothetical protein